MRRSDSADLSWARANDLVLSSLTASIMPEIEQRIPEDSQERHFSYDEVLSIAQFAARTGLTMGRAGIEAWEAARIANHEPLITGDQQVAPRKLL